ncbi:MAG TPA: hypothetical protein VND91_03880 [Candidatus Saccharimonadia bacterium]|nr:hypothetical protein [Candidatus Saccharimonadia bacterium]
MANSPAGISRRPVTGSMVTSSCGVREYAVSVAQRIAGEDTVMTGVDEFARRLAESPEWQALLQRVAELELEVAALRGDPSTTIVIGGASAECPMCGSDQFHKAAKADPAHGIMTDHWVCGECEHEEDLPRDTLPA